MEQSRKMSKNVKQCRSNLWGDLYNMTNNASESLYVKDLSKIKMSNLDSLPPKNGHFRHFSVTTAKKTNFQLNQ